MVVDDWIRETMKGMREFSYFVRKFDFNATPSNNLIKIPVDPNRWSLVGCIPIQNAPR